MPKTAVARLDEPLKHQADRDVVFAQGPSAPCPSGGRRLPAHALAHTIVLGAAAVAGGLLQRQQDDLAVNDAKPAVSDQGPILPVNNPSPTGPQPAKPACLPVIVNPTWDVGLPDLDARGQFSPCGLHASMTFNGTVSMPVNCPGTVYFVQYTQPNRSLVSCSGAKDEGVCVNPALGLDGGWPYAFGNQINTDQNPGSSVALHDEDVPGIKNISRPDIGWVRICMDDWFTTYIVFEDRAKSLTSLGWMSWNVGAHAERGDGTCPGKTTTNDCSGWKITIATASKASDFTVGAMAPEQALDRAVAPVSLIPADCEPTACARSAPGQ